MTEPHQDDEITVMLRQLDILELRLGKGANSQQPAIEQANTLLKRLREVSSLAVEVNVSSENIHVGGDIVGGDKVGGDKVGGDIVRQTAGRDMSGVAGSRSSASNTAVSTISTIEELVNTLEQVAEEVASSDLRAKEKQQLLSSLYWLTEHSTDPVAPPAADIAARTSPLKQAAQWVKDKLGKIAVEAGALVAAHWVVVALAAL
jgi:hypothetical protein